MTRKNLGDDVYIEIMDIRVKNGRVECLSRFNRIKSDGPFIGTFGYRWRKICGKGVFVPSLYRAYAQRMTYKKVRHIERQRNIPRPKRAVYASSVLRWDSSLRSE